MAWFRWPWQTREKLLAPSKTPGYGQTAPGSPSLLFHWEERPPFSILTGEMMLLDPKLSLAVAIRNGILKQLEVDIVGGHPKIKDFVMHQWGEVWRLMGSRAIEARYFGYRGFEPLYREDRDLYSGKVVVEDFRDFHCRDIRPLVSSGRVVGMTVRNINRQNIATAGWAGGGPAGDASPGTLKLWEPKSLWLTYHNRYGSHFGMPILDRSYAPWHEKWQRGGAIKLRQLRMMKDAWIGDVVTYPSNKRIILPDGTAVSYRDILREIAELRMSGGVLAMPSDLHPESKTPLFGYQPPQDTSGSDMIFQWNDHLNIEMTEGQEVPKEITEAAETGSGFSGRSIPFIGMLACFQDEADDYVKAIDQQILRPLVRLNYSTEPSYTLRARSLIDTIGKLMGGDGGADNGSAGSGSGMPAQVLRSPGNMATNVPRSTGSNIGERATATGALALSADSDFSRPRALLLDRVDRISARQVRDPHGQTVGGVFYGPGEWVAGDVLRLADEVELARIPLPRRLRVWQLSDAPAGQHWVTIGGRVEGDKKHVGGFPVLLDGEGRIVAGGPAAIRGDHVSNAKNNFDKARKGKGKPAGEKSPTDDPPGKPLVKGNQEDHDFYVDRARERFDAGMSLSGVRDDLTKKFGDMLSPDDIETAATAAHQHWMDTGDKTPDGDRWPKSWKGLVNKQAEKWGISPELYEEMASTVWKERVEYTQEREEAKAYARQRLKVNAGALHTLESKGWDSAKTGKKLRGFDDIGRQIAGMYPILGWGGGAEDSREDQADRDYGDLVWELIKEGKKTTPSKLSREFHQEIDGYLQAAIDKAGYQDFKNEHDIEDDDEDPWQRKDKQEAVPFSDQMPAGILSPILFEPAKFSCLMFDIPDGLSRDLRDMFRRVDVDDLATKSLMTANGGGPNDGFHITVKYGLHCDDVEEVRAALIDVGPVAIRFGETSVFAGGEDGDVIKIEIEGRGIRYLNRRISESLRCTDTHPEYQPHCTIAYVKPGQGEKYAARLQDLRGRSVAFDRLVFSNRARVRTSIELDGPVKQFAT